MSQKKHKYDRYLLKDDVILTIQNYIRRIQMNDYGDDSGIRELYGVMEQIEKMLPVYFLNKEVQDDE